MDYTAPPAYTQLARVSVPVPQGVTLASQGKSRATASAWVGGAISAFLQIRPVAPWLVMLPTQVEGIVEAEDRAAVALLLESGGSRVLGAVQDAIASTPRFFPRSHLVLKPDRLDLEKLAILVYTDLDPEVLIEREEALLDQWWVPEHGDILDSITILIRRQGSGR